MENTKVKDWVLDIGADLIGGILIALGIYNFALYANFPVAGFSGIAIILYHIFGLPIGIGTILLNVPVSIFCYKFLGKGFFFRSVKSMVISSLVVDYVATIVSSIRWRKTARCSVYGSTLWSRICIDLYAGFFNRRSGFHHSVHS